MKKCLFDELAIFDQFYLYDDSNSVLWTKAEWSISSPRNATDGSGSVYFFANQQVFMEERPKEVKSDRKTKLVKVSYEKFYWVNADLSLNDPTNVVTWSISPSQLKVEEVKYEISLR